MGWPITIESCSWIDFISVAYASWYHWNCGRTQRKAAIINQLACPSYSLYVQLLWYPMYYPRGMKARVSPVQWSKPHSILVPTQDSNPGGRIQNHKRWPLHYHCTAEPQISSCPTCTQDAKYPKCLKVGIVKIEMVYEISDHDLALANLTTKCYKYPQRTYQYHDIKNIDLDLFKQNILSSPLFSNPNPTVVDGYADGDWRLK